MKKSRDRRQLERTSEDVWRQHEEMYEVENALLVWPATTGVYYDQKQLSDTAATDSPIWRTGGDENARASPPDEQLYLTYCSLFASLAQILFVPSRKFPFLLYLFVFPPHSAPPSHL